MLHISETFFLPSRAGKSVLIFKSNKFWVNNHYRNKLNWACRDKDTRGCLCRVQTTLEGRFIKVKGDHNHPPNFTPENFTNPIPERKINANPIPIRKIRTEVSNIKKEDWHAAVLCSEGWKIKS
ncbi:putative FLYWCH-type zinc finger-containing protein 1 [Operophtera brumata]|uniref:Putative FLYWCH-type zinc finger-containing protein 1 n=1 Tax=Operophtera brumata TaxID=104452 RepID=A0A0L7L3T6_OPEBR|nr:putative FLYWCH-type zinc finger-containing protein 1 [Operophtera brumata]